MVFLSIRSILSPNILIEWSTASELDTVGFNIYRSDSPERGYQKINKHLIPSQGDALSGGDYLYRDNSVDEGKTYYYQLEDIDSVGNATRHDSIVIHAVNSGWIELFGGVLLLILSSLGLLVLFRRKIYDE